MVAGQMFSSSVILILLLHYAACQHNIIGGQWFGNGYSLYLSNKRGRIGGTDAVSNITFDNRWWPFWKWTTRRKFWKIHQTWKATLEWQLQIQFHLDSKEVSTMQEFLLSKWDSVLQPINNQTQTERQCTSHAPWRTMRCWQIHSTSILHQ